MGALAGRHAQSGQARPRKYVVHVPSKSERFPDEFHHHLFLSATDLLSSSGRATNDLTVELATKRRQDNLSCHLIRDTARACTANNLPGLNIEITSTPHHTWTRPGHKLPPVVTEMLIKPQLLLGLRTEIHWTRLVLRLASNSCTKFSEMCDIG